MKKYLLIFLLGILFILPSNVSATTFNRCNSSIDVDVNNYQYYYYNNLTNYFNDYTYFIMYRNVDNNYRLFFTNSVSNIKVVNSTIDIPKNSVRCDMNSNFVLSNCSILSSVSSYSGVDSTYMFTNKDLCSDSYCNSYYFRSNISKQDLSDYFICSTPTYIISYYLNNELYDSYEVIKNGSHVLISYIPNIEYEFSGWTYDNNIDLTNITSNVDIYGTTILKPYYTINYYLNNELYDSFSVIKGTNYTLNNYVPPRHYEFSGWTYDNNIDLTNITSNVDIYGTTTYIPPNIEITDTFDSPIHNITLKIIGVGVPKEFDFIYVIFDFLILLVIVFTIIAPFILLFKLLGVI